MQTLNLPTYQPRVKCNENNYSIFDFIRKKYVTLTPEEWVRQHILHFLVAKKHYPVALISVEKQLIVNGLRKRFDILIFDKTGSPNIIIECKSPNVKITQNTFDQVAQYNMQLNTKYTMVSNGLQHYFCKIDTKNKRYVFLKDFPSYNFK